MKENATQILKDAGFGTRMGFGVAPAVVVVDFCKGFTTTECPLGGDYGKEIAGTNRILEIARRKRMPVIFTTVGYEESLEDCAAWILKFPSCRYLRDPKFMELDERLNYNAKIESLIVKKGASAFFGTNLSSMLAYRRVDTVIITGVTTSGCVRASAVDSCQYGYRTILPRECVGDRAQGPHEASLFDIDAKYGDVMSLEEVLEQLELY
ncbi:MAG: isochorismatase family protein [Christensenellales bacterium]|jgi:maleamate amidohydrolase